MSSSPLTTPITREDLESIIRDKYNGDRTAGLIEDVARLTRGEPLAYVIGWVPFLGLHIELTSHPLIPRPETEWWTEVLIKHLTQHWGEKSFTLLDLCAGSGAIGLSVLSLLPHATVSFGELIPEHTELIEENIEQNSLNPERADIRTGDLYESFHLKKFDRIVTNPPYIPKSRELPGSVESYEPSVALYGGEDGLDLVRRIVIDASRHLNPGGELWIECDISNIEEARRLTLEHGALSASICNDLYGRPRVVVAYYP